MSSLAKGLKNKQLMFQHIWKIWLDFCVVDHIILLLEKKGGTIFETVTDSVVIWSSCYMKWGCRNYILVLKNRNQP